jgi:trimethylamine--corrinoid protein Co-methyltransferase
MASISVRGLSDSETQRIHDLSLQVLENIGVNVCDDRMRERLLGAGGRSGPSQLRVCLPSAMVLEALARCPHEVRLSSVRGDEYVLAPGHRFFSSTLVDPFIIDYVDGPRPPRLADCQSNARLIDAIDMIQMPYKMDVDYSDVTGMQALLASNLLYMSNMSKHYVCGPHSGDDARIWMEMSEIMAGTSLANRPIVSGLVSPTSPLTFDGPFLAIVECLATHGAPLVMLPCPQAGATSPFTLAGTVVTFNAENLATLTLVQTLWQGTPLIYHNVAMGFNMRTALGSLGGPEKGLFAVAGVDMALFYGLPAGCAGSSSNSMRYDCQNGAETMAQLLPVVASRAGMITGIGSLGNGMATSPEQILFDCDLVALASYVSAGIRVDEERLGYGALTRVGPGGNFLEDPLTLELLRSGEHFQSGSFVMSMGQTAGTLMLDKLHLRAQSIVEQHAPSVPADRVQDLRAYVARHGGERWLQPITTSG